MTSLPRYGLYAVADTDWISADYLLDAVSGALQGGAVMIQLRDKHASVTGNARMLDALLTLCREHAAPFIINDDVRLAITAGADGVHIGQSDGDISAIREQLGQQAILGVSCHNDIDSARRAVSQGADYIAMGRFYSSQSKPDAPPANLDTLRRARTVLDVPIVAIGGITPDNMTALLEAGADICAVIAGIFAHGHNTADTRAAAARYQAQFEQFKS